MEVTVLNSEADREMEELLKKAVSGDKKARDILVEKNIGLVWSIVKKFQNRGYEPDDLFQIGSIGLVKAIKKFDSSFNVKFSTYAVPMIIGEIKRFMRDDGIIKVSRSIKETGSKAMAVKEILTKELCREPTIGEIAQKLEIEAEELVMAMEANTTPESLHSTLHEGDSYPILLIDRIAQGDECENTVINKLALKQVLDTLKPRERQIIVLRYFKEKTQTQIAKILGISQVQVSRIEKKILNEMRERIETG